MWQISSFDVLMNETLTLVKANGTVQGIFKASVQEQGMMTLDMLPFEPGDKAQRNLPGGRIEEMTIDDVVYSAPLAGVPAMYKLKYHRPGAGFLSVSPDSGSTPAKPRTVAIEREGSFFAGQQ